ncbi:Serine carboxypeptidase-like 46 [Camellia lanceoleosa]|uniref:Serine carboxypeptidase-like 46 n=1 Tax=Camellia lanceoleosa TaxID=1840588 RepID=A0ACC0G6I6_9ERIC|nr:Serine carboxypeptidase-like 46 [Camellia lanceoleosa]
MEIVESSSSSSLSASDRIHQLPSQTQVNYQQFSGYVTVDAKIQKALVLEAESNPASKSLVIWLNGGPGCSSLGVGAFFENGPFRPSGKALVKNEYSWNREKTKAMKASIARHAVLEEEMVFGLSSFDLSLEIKSNAGIIEDMDLGETIVGFYDRSTWT